MIIFIFGDSIAQGLWDKNGGWADRIKNYVINDGLAKNLKDYSEVYNLGIDGNTTTQILNRFDSETRDRLWPDEKYAFIFATGINDTLHRNNDEFISNPEKYRAELSEVYGKALKYTNKITFVGLTPVDESKTNPVITSSSGKCYTNDRITEFNKVLEDYCKNQNIEFVDVHGKFTQANYSDLLEDGLHPNSKGHDLIYELVLGSILPLED